MNGRQSNRFALLYVLGFLFTLIIAFGTFFVGYRMGINQTEQKYEPLKKSSLLIETDASYSHQDLVSFYYVVYQPYLQFKNEFLLQLDALGHHNNKFADQAALKEIRELAQQKYKQVSIYAVSGNSPLLKQAQNDVLNSLKLFDEGIDRNITFLGNKRGVQLAMSVSDDEYTANAVDLGLQAEHKFYTAIMKWTAKGEVNIPEHYSFDTDTTVKQWSKYPLSQKNKAIVDIMLSNQLYVPYMPQDLTAKVDQMIASGKAESLKLNSIYKIVQVVTETDAVHSQDFKKWKSTLYADELVPNLPFFVE